MNCGLCLYGCPYSLIYSSAQTLKRLIADGLVDYRPGHVVERLEPAGEGVIVHARDLRGNAVRLDAKRAFVGAGVLPSAWLALNSLGVFDEPVTMLDSQYFIFPFFRFFRTPGVDREPLSLAGAGVPGDRRSAREPPPGTCRGLQLQRFPEAGADGDAAAIRALESLDAGADVRPPAGAAMLPALR